MSFFLAEDSLTSPLLKDVNSVPFPIATGVEEIVTDAGRLVEFNEDGDVPMDFWNTEANRP